MQMSMHDSAPIEACRNPQIHQLTIARRCTPSTPTSVTISSTPNSLSARDAKRPQLKVMLNKGEGKPADGTPQTPDIELNDIQFSSIDDGNFSNPNSAPMTPEVAALCRGINATQLNESVQRQLLLSTTPFEFGIQSTRSPESASPAMLRGDQWRSVPAADHARNTVNAIRQIVDVMSVKPNPDKELIKLHLGDPTLTGSLATHAAVNDAMHAAITSGKFNGYGPAVGLHHVRVHLAAKITTAEAPVTADDVILTSGCSHALQMAIEALGNTGDNILVPCPGFPLYATLMKPHGVETRHYHLDPDNEWQMDLAHMETLIDARTKAVVMNNPSNPTGAVYTREHLQAFLAVADKYGLTVIADEIYGDMVFDGATFHPLATLTPKVPILTCDGIAKRYLVPGWRLGWIVIHDPVNALSHVRDGLRNLAQKIVGPCALVQGALPDILDNTPKSFFDDTRTLLAENARIAYEVLSATPGLRAVRPQGAMYMMVCVDRHAFPAFVHDDMAMVKAFIAEESVYCLPGSAFTYEHSFRLVLTYPNAVTRDACERIQQFCKRHYRAHSNTLAVDIDNK